MDEILFMCCRCEWCEKIESKLREEKRTELSHTEWNEMRIANRELRIALPELHFGKPTEEEKEERLWAIQFL